MVRKLAVWLAALLILGAIPAEGAVLEEKGLTLGENSLTYPVISGMTEEALQEEINARILTDGRIQERLTRMSLLLSWGSLRAGWTGGIMEDIFSAAFWAEGALDSPRNTFQWAWCSLDLRDGHEIALEELFSDEAAAVRNMETILEENVAPDLSAHLLNSELTPLPEGFFLERTGMTLLYPVGQLCTLQDRAGAVKIGWYELRDVLNLEKDSILDRMGVRNMIGTGEETAEAVAGMTAEGAFPDVPVKLGDSLQEKTDEYGMLTDPDGTVGGRLFALDGAAFRDVMLLTDDLSRDWKESRVQGIRLNRGCAWGLCIGETEREEWHRLLGEPDSEVSFDEEWAEAYRTVPGICDYYRYGDYQLQLHSDENGVLYSMMLTE